MLRRRTRRSSAAFLVASLCFAGAAQATTIRVPLDKPTIQAGINAAEEGDTILVAPDTYSGDGNCGISIYSNVVLMAQADHTVTIIDCEGLLDGAIRVIGGYGEYPSPTIRGFSIVNASASRGGGLAAIRADPVVSECIFSNCSAEYGGAVYCEEAWPTIERCTIADNTAAKGGGVYCCSLSAAAVVDCIVVGNKAAISGGGLCLERNDSPGAVRGCTIVANDAPVGAGITFGSTSGLRVTNTIIAFNGPGEGACCLEPGPLHLPEITRCCVFGNAGGDSLCGEYVNNFYSDPLFCDLDVGDFTLCSTSPCLPGCNPWRELVGALGQGCGKCSSPVEPTSWGRLKAMYLPGRD